MDRIYVQTNDAEHNEVVAFDRDADPGKHTLVAGRTRGDPNRLPLFIGAGLTDRCDPDSRDPIDIEAVVEVAMRAEPRLTRLVVDTVAAADFSRLEVP